MTYAIHFIHFVLPLVQSYIFVRPQLRHLCNHVNIAVCHHPAYFSLNQRNDTKNAYFAIDSTKVVISLSHLAFLLPCGAM